MSQSNFFRGADAGDQTDESAGRPKWIVPATAAVSAVLVAALAFFFLVDSGEGGVDDAPVTLTLSGEKPEPVSTPAASQPANVAPPTEAAQPEIPEPVGKLRDPFSPLVVAAQPKVTPLASAPPRRTLVPTSRPSVTPNPVRSWRPLPPVVVSTPTVPPRVVPRTVPPRMTAPPRVDMPPAPVPVPAPAPVPAPDVPQPMPTQPTQPPRVKFTLIEVFDDNTKAKIQLGRALPVVVDVRNVDGPILVLRLEDGRTGTFRYGDSIFDAEEGATVRITL